MNSNHDDTPSGGTAGTPRRRARRTHWRGKPTLTREAIGYAALRVIARTQPVPLTMRDLADELGVSARALYNYVNDREDLLALAVNLAGADMPLPRLDPGDWPASLRAYCHDLRGYYRAYPGLLRLGRTETAHLIGHIHPRPLEVYDRLLEFFLAVGLPLLAAGRAMYVTVLTVAGFTEVWDTGFDQPPEDVDLRQFHTLVPEAVLRDHPDLAVPTLRRAVAQFPPHTPDDAFEAVLDTLTAGITVQLHQSSGNDQPT